MWVDCKIAKLARWYWKSLLLGVLGSLLLTALQLWVLSGAWAAWLQCVWLLVCMAGAYMRAPPPVAAWTAGKMPPCGSEALSQALAILQRQVRTAIDKSEDAVMASVTTLSQIQQASQVLHQEAQQALAHSTAVTTQISELSADSQQALQALEVQQQAMTVLQKEKDAQVSQAMQGVQGLTPLLDMIRNIAKQTHLLSFNAAIEAARAGDAGNGFKIVATEVRNLAQQTSDATQKIEAGISTVQGAVQNDAAHGAVELGQMVHSVQGIQSLLTRNMAHSAQLGPYLLQVSQGMDVGTVHIRDQVSHALTQMQFQDVLRQILEQVEQGLQAIGSCTQACTTVPMLDQQMHALLQEWEQRYVMQDQRLAHANVQPDAAAAAKSAPDIELF